MPRMIIVAAAGVAFTGLAYTGWRALSAPAAPPPHAVMPAPVHHVPMVNLLTADRDVPAGSFLRPSDLASTTVLASGAPDTAWRDTPAIRISLVGALVRRSIPHDSMLLPAELLLAGDHGFLAALLAPGMRAFTIPHDEIISGAELIWPGDRIDLILTQQMPSTTTLGHQISAETVLTDLRVLAVDRQLVQPAPSADHDAVHADPTAGMVTLEVSPADAEKLAVALRLGRVAFAVRSSSGSLLGQTTATAKPMHEARATWADAVMHSLDEVQVPTPPPSISLHVYDGAGGTEYKF